LLFLFSVNYKYKESWHILRGYVRYKKTFDRIAEAKGAGMIIKMNLQKSINEMQLRIEFSGSVLVKRGNTRLVEASAGYANRAEKIRNSIATRFGIASGCKLFTAIAISQLVEEGRLSFEAKLSDCLDISFPAFDKEITIHHLLTHTAGIPDYFDEEVMDDFEELWVENPMYLMRSLESFLPLFQNEPMKLKVGERFHYNNAGYILLGLIVEQASGLKFPDYVTENIFRKAGMENAGYFEFDALPGQTAIGYIELPEGTWKTNIYSLPVKGGSDGGAFVTVNDMVRLWDALLNYELLSESFTNKLLTPYAQEDEGDFYGYGVWIKKKDDIIFKYHVMGYDPGVSFYSAYYPEEKMQVVVCSNESAGAFDILEAIEEEINGYGVIK